MNQEAINYLSKVDKKLGRLIKRIGPCTLRPNNGQSPYESLVEAVVYQQLSGKAASAILGRFKELYPRKRFPAPSNVVDKITGSSLESCIETGKRNKKRKPYISRPDPLLAPFD